MKKYKVTGRLSGQAELSSEGGRIVCMKACGIPLPPVGADIEVEWGTCDTSFLSRWSGTISAILVSVRADRVKLRMEDGVEFYGLADSLPPMPDGSVSKFEIEAGGPVTEIEVGITEEGVTVDMLAVPPTHVRFELVGERLVATYVPTGETSLVEAAPDGTLEIPTSIATEWMARHARRRRRAS